jgi:hypothetical protein
MQGVEEVVLGRLFKVTTFKHFGPWVVSRGVFYHFKKRFGKIEI